MQYRQDARRAQGDRARLLRHPERALTKAFASAPEILFVTAAGNSNQNASFVEDIPADRAAELAHGRCSRQGGDEASFTSYGPTVKVHANGYQVESVIPGGEKLAESGTTIPTAGGQPCREDPRVN